MLIIFNPKKKERFKKEHRLYLKKKFGHKWKYSLNKFLYDTYDQSFQGYISVNPSFTLNKKTYLSRMNKTIKINRTDSFSELPLISKSWGFLIYYSQLDGQIMWLYTMFYMTLHREKIKNIELEFQDTVNHFRRHWYQNSLCPPLYLDSYKKKLNIRFYRRPEICPPDYEFAYNRKMPPLVFSGVPHVSDIDKMNYELAMDNTRFRAKRLVKSRLKFLKSLLIRFKFLFFRLKIYIEHYSYILENFVFIFRFIYNFLRKSKFFLMTLEFLQLNRFFFEEMRKIQYCISNLRTCFSSLKFEILHDFWFYFYDLHFIFDYINILYKEQEDTVDCRIWLHDVVIFHAGYESIAFHVNQLCQDLDFFTNYLSVLLEYFFSFIIRYKWYIRDLLKFFNFLILNLKKRKNFNMLSYYCNFFFKLVVYLNKIIMYK